jgi:hypothetical protein
LRSDSLTRTYTEEEHRELMNQQHNQLRLTFMSEIDRTQSYHRMYQENVQKVITALKFSLKKAKTESRAAKAEAEQTKETFMESLTWFDVASWALKKLCCSRR